MIKEKQCCWGVSGTSQNTRQFVVIIDGNRPQMCGLFLRRKECTTSYGNNGSYDVLYVLCGVSHVGKTTILKQLLQREPLLEQLVTTTTRSSAPIQVLS